MQASELHPGARGTARSHGGEHRGDCLSHGLHRRRATGGSSHQGHGAAAPTPTIAPAARSGSCSCCYSEAVFARHPIPYSRVLLIELDVFRDERGCFLETYQADRYQSRNRRPLRGRTILRSVRGTIRGLHLEVARPQAKLIRVIVGEIFRCRGGRAPRVRKPSGNGSASDSPATATSNASEGFAHGFSV